MSSYSDKTLVAYVCPTSKLRPRPLSAHMHTCKAAPGHAGRCAHAIQNPSRLGAIAKVGTLSHDLGCTAVGACSLSKGALLRRVPVCAPASAHAAIKAKVLWQLLGTTEQGTTNTKIIPISQPTSSQHRPACVATRPLKINLCTHMN
jgi:hypothetical protein